MFLVDIQTVSSYSCRINKSYPTVIKILLHNIGRAGAKNRRRRAVATRLPSQGTRDGRAQTSAPSLTRAYLNFAD